MTSVSNPADGDELMAYQVGPGQVYRTALGERVEIVADDGPGGKPLKVRFPEREPQLERDGSQRESHIQFQSRYAFANAANHEGYELVAIDGSTRDVADESEQLPGEWTNECPPRCPVCGAWMTTGFDGEGFPSAQCGNRSCHGFMDDRELIDRGYFRECGGR